MLSHLSIRRRLLLISLFIVLALAMLTLLSARSTYQELRAEKDAQTRYQVETAWSLVRGYAEQVTAGTLTDEVAKAQARQALKGIRYGNNDYFWVNDLKPAMIMHPIKPELDGKDLSAVADPSGKHLFVAFVEATANSPQGAHVEYLWPKPGHDAPVAKVSFVKRFAPWGWIIGTGVYIDDIEQQYQRTLAKLIAFSVGVLVILLLLLGWLSRTITAPLTITTRALSHLADGEGDLRQRLPLQGGDELSRLCGNFNRFTGQMATLVQEVQRIAAGNEAAAQRMSDVARQHHTLANAQVADTAEASRSVASVTEHCAQIGQHAQDAAQLATQAMTMGHEGAQLMQRSDAAVKRLTEQLTHSVQQVEQLGGDSQRIDNVLEVIRSIAEQTNLLALNAAIEAARAGEQGRGFAVVADEVRTLANRTHASTDEIRTLIVNVQQGSRQVSEQISQLQQLSDETARLTLAVGEVIERITTVVDKMGGMNDAVASAASEQTREVDGINRHMETIAGAAHRALEHNLQTEQSAGELTTLSHQLSTLVSRYQT